MVSFIIRVVISEQNLFKSTNTFGVEVKMVRWKGGGGIYIWLIVEKALAEGMELEFTAWQNQSEIKSWAEKRYS